MSKVWTTEDLRKEERRWLEARWVFAIGVAIAFIGMFSTRFITESLTSTVSKISDVIFYGSICYVVVCTILYLRIHKKVDYKKEGKQLRKELGIKKLDFRKLNDGSYEMHHQLYLKEEMKEMRDKGMTSDEITARWKKDLVSDFKRLESFMRAKDLKGDPVVIHTYTHIRMYKIWNKIAQDVGIELEVMKGNNQKPVGFKWRAWKDGVYRTSGKKADKGSIPKDIEWNKYVLTSKTE